MKRLQNILRVFSTAVVLALLVVSSLAAPVLAAADITLSEDEGSIGDEITIYGEGFNKSTDTTEKYAVIYFSREEAGNFDDIDADVTIYEKVKDGLALDTDGEFEVDIDIPDELNDGDEDEDVTSGTYYFYVCHYLVTTPPEVDVNIRAVAEFTVTGGEISISDSSGPVDTEVKITGTDFADDEEITIEFDGDDVRIEDGNEDTNSAGGFNSYIYIPDSTAGDHTIKVIVGSTEVEEDFEVEPEVTITPTSGEAGASIAVSGTGFARRGDITIFFNNVGLKTANAGTDGTFNAVTLTVPSGFGAGIYNVDAEDEDNNSDSAKFTMVVSAAPEPEPEPEPEPTPTPAPAPSTVVANISQETGQIGSGLIVSGSGFKSGATVIVKYDGVEVITAPADANGIFVALFDVPASKYGEHIVTASDGISTQELIFSVESTPPIVPTPYLPEMGVKVKSPVLFDWKDVTDDSKPVTYKLQIASSNLFTAASVMLEKMELVQSEYTLTDEEVVSLAESDTTYYWRVRAVDAASNEGNWTGAGEFTISAGFKGIPSWALYTIAGVLAILLFGLGYWLGRRASFYY